MPDTTTQLTSRNRKRLDDEPKVNKSLYKALRILECFTEARPDWSVSELSRELGIGKSSVSTMLSLLASMNLVNQSPSTRRYQLGLRCLELGYLASSRMIIRDYAFPYLESLLKGNRIIYMGIPYQDEVLYIETLFPIRRQINYSVAGRRAPLYCTGIGKAMLANMPDAYIDTYVQTTPLVKQTPNTIADPAKLKAELAVTRERGYSIDHQEREVGIQCVGAPIKRDNGELVAAISISGPANEITLDAIPEIAVEALTASRNIATKLASAGY